MEEAALDDKKVKIQQNQMLKASWSRALEDKSSLAPETDTDYSTCGVAAAQSFVGEDADRISRLRMQKEQLRKWVQDQMQEKDNLRATEADEDAQWAEYIRETTFLREEAANRYFSHLNANCVCISLITVVLYLLESLS